MTHCILPSDIDLATKLVAANQPDEVIVTALVRRGIESASAAQIIADLRNGRKVVPQFPPGLQVSAVRRSRSRDTGPVSEPREPSPAPEPEVRPEEPVKLPAKRRQRSRFFWVMAGIPVCLVALVMGILISKRFHSSGDDSPSGKPRTVAAARELPSPAESRQKVPLASLPAGSLPVTSGQAAAAGQKALTIPLVLELRPDGLRIGDSPVTAGAALACVTKVLGPPTRSTPAGQADTTIYAYDSHGLLIYSDKTSGKDSIVLDCEANGGANGTTSPFTGVLKVEGRVVGPETDFKTLATIQQLGFNISGSEGGLLSGHYHNLNLAFAYFKTPRRLSVIEIDLK
jgi:hypothetical protein